MRFARALAVVACLWTSSSAQVIQVATTSVASVSLGDLNHSVTSYWKLEEAAGAVRADSKGTNNLTDTGSLLNGAAKIGNGTANNGTGNKFVSIASNDSLAYVTGRPFFVWAWVNLNVLTGGTRTAVEKGTGITAATLAWRLHFNATDLIFQSSNGTANTSTSTTATAFPGYSLTATTWILLYGGHDGTSSFVGVNNVDCVDAVGCPAGGKFRFSTAATTILDSGSFPFVIGAGGSGGSAAWNGSIDEVGFVSGRMMTADDVRVIYNAGAGAQYPF